MDHKITTITQTVTLPAGPERVYAALTDPKQHSAFTGAEATGEPKIGGTFTAWDGYITGQYLELVPNQKIVADWSTTEWPEGYRPSKITITLTPEGDQTKLELLHENVPAQQADDYDSGWHQSYWLPLEAYLQS